MPLKHQGKGCVSHNVRKEKAAGRKQKQAVAIALSACGKSRKGKKHGSPRFRSSKR